MSTCTHSTFLEYFEVWDHREQFLEEFTIGFSSCGISLFKCYVIQSNTDNS